MYKRQGAGGTVSHHDMATVKIHGFSGECALLLKVFAGINAGFYCLTSCTMQGSRLLGTTKVFNLLMCLFAGCACRDLGKTTQCAKPVAWLGHLSQEPI